MSDVIRVNERFEIHMNMPLNQFAVGNNLAYQARDLKDPEAIIFALICDSRNIPRMHAIDAYARAGAVPLLYLSGIGQLVGEQGNKVVLFFNMPLGGVVLPTTRSGIPVPSGPTWNEESLCAWILEPILEVLIILERLKLSHRTIRVDNMFFNTPNRTGRIILGECISYPPGFNQGALYEPIESGMCSPFGRGEGDASDDVYALGVSTLILLYGHNPWETMEDTAIVRRKLESGSYGFLVSNLKLSNRMADFFHGVLSDNPRERWSVKETQQWLSGGGRLRIPYLGLPKKAIHPFPMDGVIKINNVRSLAFELVTNPKEAIKIIEKPELRLWLRNSLGDKIRAEGLLEILEQYPPQKLPDACLLLAIQHLDKAFPLFWGGQIFTVGGLGTMMAKAAQDQEAVTPYIDILLSGIMNVYGSSLEKPTPEMIEFFENYPILKKYLETNLPGYGLERCLYELNPGLRCLSPCFLDANVYTPPDLIAALESITGTSQCPSFPLDRHMAAFLATRWKALNPLDIRDLGKSQVDIKSLAALRILAELQVVCQIPSLPKLTNWMGEICSQLVNNYRNTRTREQLRHEVDRILPLGSLSKLLELVGNRQALVQDNCYFEAAKSEFLMIEGEIRAIESNIMRSNRSSERMGKRLALNLGSFMSVIFIALFMLAKVFR